ncbi:MAG TPA: PQQ-dependent sugar dehydrogenase [Burkholderiaceae bacterium]|nr:PQQ-dependent sugar dehydrogenase [Burkholderiaceae bacterium]
METRFSGLRTATVALAFIALASCSGSDDGPNAPADGSNAPPVPVITSPAEGARFKAGDTLSFTGSASDPEDGTLGAGSLTWWVELHHDDHTHPFLQPGPGGSGSAEVPTRGETSDNIWLRFHLKAVDSAGLSAEVTRDVMPEKVQFTLTTEPSGLSLTLDGQPFTAPLTVTGVVGIERDLGAADQVFNGRNYRFSNWNDGGAATHTISTPPSSRTFIATFIDAGPAANQPPTVSLAAPADGSTGFVGTPIMLQATAADADGSIAGVQFFDGATAIGTATTVPYSISWTPSTTGVHTLTARASDNGGASATSAAVSVTIASSTGDTQPPTVNITTPAPFADGLTGTVTFSANATDNVGVANVEFQIDGQPLATDTSSPYSTTVDTTLHARGQHVLRVRASDSAGNRSAWTSVIVRFGGTRSTPAGITRTLGWVTGLSFATAFTQLPDGRLLVALQPGQLRVVQSDGTLLAQPMLSLSGVDSQSERGLLGVTAHPAFASNGFIYVYYTSTQGGSHNRISRFTVSGNTASGETVLVDLPLLSSAQGHNAGAIHFGTDGKLYVAVGDNYQSDKAQDLNSVFGKMLRFNDDGTIPGDNPHCTTPGNLSCAVWARGLRNPFTFAVQPGTGRILINDVGNHDWEEINLGAAGANYGWPLSEGPTTAAGITAPLLAYPHAETSPPGTGPGGFLAGTCVIGGGFYPDNGPFPPTWRGGYFFADLGREFVAFVDLKNDNAVYSFGSSGRRPVGLLVANDGAVLVLTQQDGIVRFTAP